MNILKEMWTQKPAQVPRIFWFNIPFAEEAEVMYFVGYSESVWFGQRKKAKKMCIYLRFQ